MKIGLVSGGGQSDTVGNPLRYPIIVEVTQNGTPTSGYTVQFVTSGCGQTDTISTLSQPDGTAIFSWSIEGTGQQSLNAYVLNYKNQKVDSVSVAATGLQPSPGWHNSACSLQGSSSATSFCKLSTGRLFTCYNSEKTYLRYSDDNGVSWNAVKSLGNNHTITWIMSSPSDELFAFTEGTDGTFYSTNAGQTWTNLGVPPFNTVIFSSIVCTASGKLLAASAVDPPLSISEDKGKTWTTVPFSAFIPQNMNSPHFIDPTEDADGNLYVIEMQDENLFKSTDGGKTWKLIPETGIYLPGTDFAFYIDKNNWFYKNYASAGGGILISKDKGVTYNLWMSSPNSLLHDMSLQSDGNFYYEAGPGLYSFDGTSIKQISGNAGPYIVAKNNNIVVASGNIKYFVN